LCYHHCCRYIYITTTSNVTNNGSIVKTSLQSQDVNQYDVLVTNLTKPTQIVIDFYTGLLFFNDIGRHVIMSVRYDGSNLAVVLGPQHVYMPQCLAVFEDEVFYCETLSHQLYHANKFGQSSPLQLKGNSSALTFAHPLLQPAEDPYEKLCKLHCIVPDCCIRMVPMTVLSTVSQPCTGNPCDAGLCLPVNDTLYRCMCLDGYKFESTRGCIKDPCHGDPCRPGVCLPEGDGYVCECPHGYQSDGNNCHSTLQQSEKKGKLF